MAPKIILRQMQSNIEWSKPVLQNQVGMGAVGSERPDQAVLLLAIWSSLMTLQRTAEPLFLSS